MKDTNLSNIATELADSLHEYYANGIDAEQVLVNAGISPASELTNIISLSQIEFDEIQVDLEGATAAQNAQIDAYVSSVVEEILETANLI